MKLLKVISDSVGPTFKVEPGSDDPYIGSGRDGQGLNLPRSKPSLPHDVGNDEFNTPDRESPQVWNLDENPNEYGTQMTEFYEMYDFNDDPLRASAIDDEDEDQKIVSWRLITREDEKKPEIESWHPITEDNYVGGPARSEARLRQLARNGIWRFKTDDPNWRSQENLITPYMVNNWTDPPEDFDPAPNKGSHLNVEEENFDIVNLKVSEQANLKEENVVTPEEQISRNDKTGTFAALPLLPVKLKWLPKDAAVLTLMSMGVIVLGHGPQLRWMEITSVKYDKLVSDKRYNSEVVVFNVEAEVRMGDKVLKELREHGTFAEACQKLYREAQRVK